MKNKSNYVGGFTLVEMMVVLSIMAILASFVYPSYADYVARAKAVEAFTEIEKIQSKIKQYYLDNNTLNNCCTDNSFSETKNFNIEVTLGVKALESNAEDFQVVLSSKKLSSSDKPELSYKITNSGGEYLYETLSLPNNWVMNNNCWVYNKQGDCYEK